MKQYYSTLTAADLSGASATFHTISAPFAGKLLLDESYIRVGEVVGAATTAATVTITVGGTLVSTTTPSSTTLTAIGDCVALTPTSDKYVEFAAGDDIVIAHTQATGGTTTGTAYLHLSLEWASV
jgi:hypothetical protein